MTKLFLIATGALLSIAATAPVAARDGATIAATIAPEVTRSPATELKYCIVEDAPSSHMQRKVCMTRAEWRGRGVDVSSSR